jgi:hypothetical protein
VSPRIHPQCTCLKRLYICSGRIEADEVGGSTTTTQTFES